MKSIQLKSLMRTRRATTSPAAWMVPAVVLLLTAVLVVGLTTPTWANVYASGMAKTGDMTFSYILNENADTNVQIQVWKVGGAMAYSQDLGPQTKGVHSWTWDGSGAESFTSYTAKVVASDDGYAAWTQISADATSTSFEDPVGVSVYNDQNSAKFGTAYVSVARVGTSVFGRAVSDGIYKVKADGTDDGLSTGGQAWPGSSSPWKSCIGPDGHLYVSDLSNDLAYEFNDDLSVATQLTDSTNLTNYGQTYAQWVGGILVYGTGADRKIALVDNNYYDTTRKGIIQYDIGTNTTVTPGDIGTQVIPRSYFTFYPYDVSRDSAGNWYICQMRATAGQAPPLSKFLDGAYPLTTPAWEASSASPYICAKGIDLYEPKDQIAYGAYNGVSDTNIRGWVRIFKMSDGTYTDGFKAGSCINDVAFDAAGNITTVDNLTEWMRVWSPPDGANSFTSQTYFTFDVGSVQTYVLTVNASPTAGGTVTGAGEYSSGRIVTVTAAENDGYRFLKWTDGSGTEKSTSYSYTFSMPASELTLNAVFEATTQKKLTLVAVPPEAADTLTGAGWYEPGSGAAISTTAKPLWTFSKWTTDAGGATTATTVPAQPSASCTYTMPSIATTLYAQFVVASYNVTVAASPTAGGAPTVDGGASHQYNTSVTVRANPNTGYYFMNWTDGTGAIKSRKPNYTFNMPGAAVALTANYVKAMFCEGFEGLVPGAAQAKGTIDMNFPTGDNQATNGDLNSGNAWWGTGLPATAYNGSAGVEPAFVGTPWFATAHSGVNACWDGMAGNGLDYVNLGYRTNGGTAIPENIYADWWFYDPYGTTFNTTTSPYTYCADALSIVYGSGLPSNLDYPSDVNDANYDDTKFSQKISLGMSKDIATGFDNTKYQARVMLPTTALPGAYSTNGWANLSLTRSVGWHHARVTIGALNYDTLTCPVNFYIDDMTTALTSADADGVMGFNGMEMVTMWKPDGLGTTIWSNGAMYDDIAIGVPEAGPASAPVAAAATGITANSITWNWTQSGTVAGFHVFDAAASGAQKGAPTATNYPESGLPANTPISRWVSSYVVPGPPFVTWESSRTALATAYTLAAVPVFGASGNAAVNCNLGASGSAGLGDSAVFTAVNGFGDGAAKAAKYQYVWNSTAGEPSWPGTEWTTGDLTETPVAVGTYYLHLRAVNGAGVVTATTATFGPYEFAVLHVDSYGVTNKAVLDSVTGTASATKKFTVWGWVTVIDANSFTVDDGSGAPVKVLKTGHNFTSADYVSATGTLNVGVSPPELTALTVKKQN